MRHSVRNRVGAALFEMAKRGIYRSDVDATLTLPMQKVPEQNGIICYQSKMHTAEKQYLLRVMVNESENPFLIVTVYKTSKIHKYWRPHESNV